MNLCEKIGQTAWILYLALSFPVVAACSMLACMISGGFLHKFTHSNSNLISIIPELLSKATLIGFVLVLPIAWILSICIAYKCNDSRYEWLPVGGNLAIMLLAVVGNPKSDACYNDRYRIQ